MNPLVAFFLLYVNLFGPSVVILVLAWMASYHIELLGRRLIDYWFERQADALRNRDWSDRYGKGPHGD